MTRIAIIGAGAAGLMVTATILEEISNSPLLQNSKTPIHIDLFEKNTSPGKKVIISGGGRCNVTTGITDKKILLSKYTRGSTFIKYALGKFSPKKCYEWFESHGVPLKCQEDMRVFPVSDDGRDVVGVFEDIFANNREKIALHYGEWVIELSLLDQEWMNQPDISVSTSTYWRGQTWTEKYHIMTQKWSYEADVLVITTGGNAYSHTGSSGDGYAFARALGHTVTKLWPSLSSFLTKEHWLHALSGLAFEDARISFRLSPLRSEDLSGSDSPSENEKKIELTWPILLTHFGISGPLAFMLSSHLAFEKIGSIPSFEGGIQGGTASRIVHFSPLTSMRLFDWEIFFKEQFQLHPKKFIVSILSEKLPRRFAEGFIREYFTHIEDTFAASISRLDREKLSKLLGEWIPITLLERRPGDEFVTAWGVNTDEIDPETMESKLRKNLYFAGEVLNVDGYTGWFSLQICWASGYVAGKSIILSSRI